MNTEIWKPIPGFPDYAASDQGRILSRRPWRGTKERVMSTPLNPQTGYPQVRITDGVEFSTHALHSLVMLAFVGPRLDGQEVRHLDGNRQNANLSNLAYGTQSENVADALAHGTHFPSCRTTCQNGHPYSTENTVTYTRPNGSKYRQCRTCQHVSRMAYRDRRRGAA